MTLTFQPNTYGFGRGNGIATDEMRNDWNAFFNTVPAGTAINWAGGVLQSLGNGEAYYSSADMPNGGVRLNVASIDNPNTIQMLVEQSPGIAAEWSRYGIAPSTAGAAYYDQQRQASYADGTAAPSLATHGDSMESNQQYFQTHPADPIVDYVNTIKTIAAQPPGTTVQPPPVTQPPGTTIQPPPATTIQPPPVTQPPGSGYSWYQPGVLPPPPPLVVQNPTGNPTVPGTSLPPPGPLTTTQPLGAYQPQYRMPAFNALYQDQLRRMQMPAPRFNFQSQQPDQSGALTNVISNG